MGHAELALLRLVDLWLLPVIYLGFSLLVSLVNLSTGRLWVFAKATAMSCLTLAVLGLVCTCVEGSSMLPLAPVLQLGPWGAISFSARADLIGNLFLVMVNLIGWIIVGFSHHYLDGEKGQRRYVVALLVTLAAVNVVVIANNVLVLAVAWVFTSLALHALLTFYPNRTQAIFAAHKKFIVSRIADVCLFVAIGLLSHALGTLELDQLKNGVAQLSTLPDNLQFAALLLALTAALKCAQLPFHGWLIQVMEAPTPVSALLHAGIVNLGGFLLIRFSFLMSSSATAQIFLVGIGSITTVIAALVMMTRISIKVSLAWSTCAQMGFMLMQCGLGAYELAALHLLAHSLYKAHAFLNSGSTNAKLNLMVGEGKSTGLASRLVSPFVGVLIVFALFGLVHQSPTVEQPMFAFAIIIALALAPLLTFHVEVKSLVGNAKFVLIAIVLVAVYLGLHQVFASYLGISVVDRAGWMSMRVMWVVGLFIGLYVLQSIVLAYPTHAISKKLYPYFYGGFFLDDLFTRLTFWIWPAPVKSSANRSHCA